MLSVVNGRTDARADFASRSIIHLQFRRTTTGIERARRLDERIRSLPSPSIALTHGSTVEFAERRIVHHGVLTWDWSNGHSNRVAIDIGEIVVIGTPPPIQGEFGQGHGRLTADSIASHTVAVDRSTAITGGTSESSVDRSTSRSRPDASTCLGKRRSSRSFHCSSMSSYPSIGNREIFRCARLHFESSAVDQRIALDTEPLFLIGWFSASKALSR